MKIWQAIRNDQEHGAERLVSEYGNRLYAAAVLLCLNDHDAEELVFMTFDRAIRKIGQYVPGGDFFNWLYTIMLNFRRMDLRKHKAEIVPVGSPTELPEQATEALPDMLAQAEIESVQMAVRKLPEPLRTVVTLRYFNDRPVDEIASLTGIPIGTVKSRLYAARMELARLLRKNRTRDKS